MPKNKEIQRKIHDTNAIKSPQYQKYLSFTQKLYQSDTHDKNNYNMYDLSSS